MQHQRGFTLAEVLITMGIIGVVAALTIPSLSTAYQKRVMTTQLQKAYAEISQAAGMVVADEMTNDFRTSRAVRNNRFIDKYLTGSYTYISGPYEYVDGGGDFYLQNELGDNYQCKQTKAGAVFCMANGQSHGFLDVNGAKGPNSIGRDAFSIGFNKSGSIDPDYSVFLGRIVEEDWDLDAAH